jgi:Fis family transcriptional regulator
MSQQNEIASAVTRTLNQYFKDLEGESPAALHDLVMRSAERPMLEFVLAHTDGNQTLAAQLLGINRNTLRRKLAEYDLI